MTKASLLRCLALLSTLALAANDLKNPGLEPDARGRLEAWQILYPEASRLDTQCVRHGRTSLRATVTAKKRFGILQEVTYPKPDMTPVIFGGWSKPLDITNPYEYCVYLDIFYADGTNAWNKRAKWSPFNRHWHQAIGCFFPEKPIAKIQFYILIRKATGTAWFDDPFLIRKQPTTENTPVDILTLAPFQPLTCRISTAFLNPKATWKATLVDSDGKHLSQTTGTGKKMTWQTDLPRPATAMKLQVSCGQETQTSTYPFPTTQNHILLHQRDFQVWTADSMTYVTPQDPPPQNPPQDIQLELARNERESAQLLITAGDNPLKDVTLQLPQLKRKDGTDFTGTLTWQRVGYLPRPLTEAMHPYGFGPNARWFPDPLLPPRPFSIFRQTTQAIWLTAYAAEDTKPGTYTGNATLQLPTGKLQVPVAVTVFDFQLPQTFSLPTAFAVMDGFLAAVYPERNLATLRRQAWDIMLDHRLNPDDISRTNPPELQDLLHARKRGMNRFNVLNLVPQPTRKVKWVPYAQTADYTPELTRTLIHRLTPVVRQLRKNNLMKYAYVYGFDERKQEYYPIIANLRDQLKKHFPDLPLMTTSGMYWDLRRKPERTDCYANDWFCPTTLKYDIQLSRKLRRKGHQVWWYVCCGPDFPYANFASLEYPAIEARILPWQTFCFEADGLLYWHVNFWKDNNRLQEDQQFHPNFHVLEICNAIGDGHLIYPGQHNLLPSIRLANIRDGSEDVDYLASLKRENAMKYCRRLTTAVTDFSRDPKLLRQLRREMAREIVRGKKR